MAKVVKVHPWYTDLPNSVMPPGERATARHVRPDGQGRHAVPLRRHRRPGIFRSRVRQAGADVVRQHVDHGQPSHRVMTADSAASLVSQARYLLIDFDGPICAVFAGHPAPQVAAQLRERLIERGVTIPPTAAGHDDPLEVFRISATANRDKADLAHQLLTELELDAIQSAEPTPCSAELLAVASAHAQSVAIVSNNSAMSINAYLRAHRISDRVTLIAGRVVDPSRMKPDPFLVYEAIIGLSEVAERGVMIGDSVSDIQAAHAARVPAIGYANRPVKHSRLANAGADAITTSIADLVKLLTGTVCLVLDS
jgi:phosphoglycolate phosphatase-like HAD superfamily hydrolase